MNEMKCYLYSRVNANDEEENWEISLWRVRYNEFLGMAQERRHHLFHGWKRLHVGTELDGYLEIVKLINTGLQEEYPGDPQETTFHLHC